MLVSLSDSYEKANDSLVKRGCKTCDWYKALPSWEQDFFDDKVREALISRGNMQRLRRAVLSEGHEVARSTFHGHVHEHHLELAAQRRNAQ
jgi:hypothetical protein